MHPQSAVGAVVLNEGSLLLVKRNREPARGEWSLPGGRVELGETLREAVVREVREETGVDIDVEDYCGIAERILRDDDGEIAHHFVIVDFFAAPRNTDLKAGDDVSEARWIGADELGTMTLTTGLMEFLTDRGVLTRVRTRAARRG